MQVQSTQSTTANYDNSIQKSQETSSTKFNMTKPFDINTFSFEDYKNVSPDELLELTKGNPELRASAGTLKMVSDYTEDDTLNKILFEKAKEAYNLNGSTNDIIKNVLAPLTFMNAPMEALDNNMDLYIANNPDKFFNSDSSNNSHSTEKSQFSQTISPSQSFKENGYYVSSNIFLKELNDFPKWYENTLDKHNWNIDVNSIMKSMRDILSKYEQQTSESNATLENYTKNNKPNALNI